MDRSSIAAVSFFWKEKSFTGWPDSSWIAFLMKLESETPGTSIGFWKERNIPAFALLSAESSLISCPSKVMVPSVCV